MKLKNLKNLVPLFFLCILQWQLQLTSKTPYKANIWLILLTFFDQVSVLTTLPLDDKCFSKHEIIASFIPSASWPNSVSTKWKNLNIGRCVSGPLKIKYRTSCSHTLLLVEPSHSIPIKFTCFNFPEISLSNK